MPVDYIVPSQSLVTGDIVKENHENWISACIKRLNIGEHNDSIVFKLLGQKVGNLPKYK